MHTDPDAPLIHLLSIKHNPLLVAMSDQQLREFVLQLRTPAPPKPKRARAKPKPPKEPELPLEARRQAIRDSI